MKTSIRTAMLAADMKSKLRKVRHTRYVVMMQAARDLSTNEQKLLILSLHFVSGLSAAEIHNHYGGNLQRIADLIRDAKSLMLRGMDDGNKREPIPVVD